jgi:excisionase family DNA binding protein
VIDEMHKNVYYPILEDRTLDSLLTVGELCQHLNVKQSFIYSLTHQKKIPYVKIGGILRFRKSVIDEWLKTLEVANVSSEGREQERRQVVCGLDYAKWKTVS